MQIGRKIYFDKFTGNILVEIGERIGGVRDTTQDEDFASYSNLQGRTIESVGVLQLEYGQYSEQFQNCYGYSVNPETNKIVFNFIPSQTGINDAKNIQIDIINQTCKSIIEEGFESNVKYGSMHTYTLRDFDQVNMKVLYDKCKAGASKVPWHYKGQEICEAWDASDFITLFEQGEQFATQQRFYSDGLVKMVNRSTTIEEIRSNIQGKPLDSDIQAEINAVLAELMVI